MLVLLTGTPTWWPEPTRTTAFEFCNESVNSPLKELMNK